MPPLPSDWMEHTITSMISDKDQAIISEIVGRYRASRVLLFGSSLEPGGNSHDIDLAVEGVPPEQFFRFYGELIFALPKPVDLVDLGPDTKFHRIIREEGIPIYVRTQGQD